MIQDFWDSEQRHSSILLWQTMSALLGGEIDSEMLTKKELAEILVAFQRQQKELRLQNKRLQESVVELERARLELLHDHEQSQAQLREHEKMALVGQLAGGVAHDFNNILLAVTASAEVLSQKYGADEYLEERLQRILVQARLAAKLVRQLLDFGRIRRSSKATTELQEFLTDMSQLLGRILPKSISVRYAPLTPDPCYVLMDHLQLQQIMLNLAINARHAMPEGGGLTITLAAEYIPEPLITRTGRLPAGQWLRIAVTDNGVGIQPDIIPHIMDRFYSTKPAGEGSGLGLNQVRNIVDRHEGKLDVVSLPGQETTFSIYLRPAPVPCEVNTGLPDSLDIPWGQGETILLVEDNPAVLLPTKELLEELNYKVAIFNDGRELLEALRNGQVAADLILSDISLPAINSAEFIARIRLLAPKLPLLLMSGHVPESKFRLQTIGNIKGFLPKPFTLAELAKAVRSALAAPVRPVGP